MRAAGYRIHRASCVSAVLVRVTNYKKNNSLYSVAKTKDSLQSQSVNSKGPNMIAHKHEELYTSDKAN